MKVNIEESWKKELEEEFEKHYFKELLGFVKDEYTNYTCYPPASKIFEAFRHTPINKVKVVILGQDPYHGPNQAHGLSFSVPNAMPAPPSLKNILKEIANEYKIPSTVTGNLENWASQGVFLLNSTLTVRASQSASHQNKGWEKFTDKVILKLSEKKENVVFLLWGGYARKKKELIQSKKHLILEAPHPSPLSAYRGFFGSNHFQLCNDYLKAKGIEEINWH